MEGSKNTSIKIVFVKPKDSSRWKYIVNNGRVHSMESDDLKRYLIELAPKLSRKILELMESFQMFLLDVDNQEILKIKTNQEEIEKFQRSSFLKMSRDYNTKIVEERKKEESKRPFEKSLQSVIGSFL